MSGFIDKFANELKNRYIKNLNIDYKSHIIEFDYIFYGIVGVIKNWIIKDYGKIDELSDKVSMIIYDNMNKYIK